MIKQIQDLHEQRHSLEERIKETRKIMANPEIKLADYFKENDSLIKLESDLESVIKQLTDLANL